MAVFEFRSVDRINFAQECIGICRRNDLNRYFSNFDFSKLDIIFQCVISKWSEIVTFIEGDNRILRNLFDFE